MSNTLARVVNTDKGGGVIERDGVKYFFVQKSLANDSGVSALDINLVPSAELSVHDETADCISFEDVVLAVKHASHTSPDLFRADPDNVGQFTFLARVFLVDFTGGAAIRSRKYDMLQLSVQTNRSKTGAKQMQVIRLVSFPFLSLSLLDCKFHRPFCPRATR